MSTGGIGLEGPQKRSEKAEVRKRMERRTLFDEYCKNETDYYD